MTSAPQTVTTRPGTTASANEATAVPPGYKQTEVGVIPEDWEVKPLAGLAAILHGFGFQSKYFATFGKYRLTTPGHFHEAGGFRDVGDKQKFYDGPLPDGYLLREGDLIVAMTEQAAGLLGSAALVPGSGSYLHNQRLGKLRMLSPDLSTRFLYRIFNSPLYRAKVRETAAGTKVKHTSPTKLLEIIVPLPPTKAEQRAIAEALSDMDKLLGSLEKLTAKKRAIKQAAMQQLLTGKTRLPGFSGEWETRRLGNIAPLQRGFDLPTSQIRPGSYAVVYSNGVLHHHERAMVNGPGVVTGRSGTIGKVHFIEKDYWPHNTALWVTSFCGNDPKFIYYLYTHIGLTRFLSGSGVPTLNRNDVHQHLASCPPLPEQRAIATVLSDMDADIAALERRLDKTRAIKQGMMQKLLTGRVRLVKPTRTTEASAC